MKKNNVGLRLQVAFGRIKPFFAPQGLITLLFSASLLLAACIYTGIAASAWLGNDADALIYPYLFQNFQSNDMILPSGHANILKFPLFSLQALLPYNEVTFTIVNILLIAGTVFGVWAVIIYIFGKRTALLAAVVLSTVLLGAQSLALQIASTTIRNIEYPIGLLFMAVIAKLITSKKITKIDSRQVITLILVSVLFAFTIAGDSLMLSSFILPTALVTSGVLMVKKGYRHSAAYGAAIVISTAIFAILVRFVLDAGGVYNLHKSAALGFHLVAPEAALASFTVASEELLRLFGARIPFTNIQPQLSLNYLSFLVLVIGIFGLIAITLKNSTALLRVKELHTRDVVLLMISMSAFATFFVYACSTLVVTKDPTGVYVPTGSERYLTLIPFLVVIGFIYTIKGAQNHIRYLYVATVSLMLLTLLLAVPTIHSQYASLAAAGRTNAETLVKIASFAKHEEIDVVMSGYWMGPAVRFHSDNQLPFISISDCNAISPHINSRATFYVPQEGAEKTMVIVDRTGFDRSYWQNCPLNEMHLHLGQPDKSIYLKNTFSGQSDIGLYIYNTDLRKNLR